MTRTYNTQNLSRVGNPKAGVAFPAMRVRMPDAQSAALLVALLGTAGRTGQAEALGALLAWALRARDESDRAAAPGKTPAL